MRTITYKSHRDCDYNPDKHFVLLTEQVKPNLLLKGLLYNQKLNTNLSCACCVGAIDCAGSCLLAGSQLFKGRSDREGVGYKERQRVRGGNKKRDEKRSRLEMRLVCSTVKVDVQESQSYLHDWMN